MGPDTYDERMSLRGDDTIRTNIAQGTSLEEVGLQQGLEGKVGLEFCGEDRGGRVYADKEVAVVWARHQQVEE